MWFLVAAAVLLVILMSSKVTLAKGQDWIIQILEINAIRFKVDPDILIAIAIVESSLNPRAYNPEGFAPPAGRRSPGRSRSSLTSRAIKGASAYVRFSMPLFGVLLERMESGVLQIGLMI
jgi:hypothetical protein